MTKDDLSQVFSQLFASGGTLGGPSRPERREPDLIEKFAKDRDALRPPFDCCKMPLERALWVLAQAKRRFNVRKLTAQQIASIIVDVLETSTSEASVRGALNRAGDRVHVHRSIPASYEIMGPGLDEISSLAAPGRTTVFSFDEGTQYSSKRTASEIVSSLRGELKICDPYCGPGTLDLLAEAKPRKGKLLTRSANLSASKKRGEFARQCRDFAREYPQVEVRDYPHPHLHDRYIISHDALVLFGCSLKDLGHKESFAVRLAKDQFEDMFTSVLTTFSRRWNQASPIR